MRVLMLLLLVLSAPLAGQEPEPLAVAEESASLEPEAPPATEIAMPRTAEPSGETTPAPSIVESSTAAAAAQPTMRNFLYQIFLTAVTALITALIWKAVF